MQLHKALCKLLWVSHKALVTPSQEQVHRGTNRTRASLLPSTGPRHTEHRESEQGKFSTYPAWTVGPV